MPAGRQVRPVPGARSCAAWPAILLAVFLVTLAAGQAPLAAQQPRRGGVLRIAMTGEPPTLDLHASPGFLQAHIGFLVFEGLFAFNSRYEPQPMLVDRWTVSANRLTYTFTLRRSVRFHHGRELTSEDVVASLTRWGRLGVQGRRVLALIASLSALDPSTVILRLREPYPLLLVALATTNQAPVIYPKDVIDEAGTGLIRRLIGTGPYRFVEHIPDRHMRLDRFDGYQARTDEADGMAGRKHASLDSMVFLPVPDAAVRVAGVTRGDYHFAQNVPDDDYERLRANPALVPVLEQPPRQAVVVLNNRQGLMTNPKIRQAFQAVIDAEAVLRASHGDPRLWQLNPSLLPKGHPLWTEAGKDLYNQRNRQRARQLLTEAGYKGEPVRWMATTEVPAWGTATQVMKPMLEAAGFVIDLQFMDWATVVSRRVRPELWDAFNLEFGYQFDPTFFVTFNAAFPGWYDSREMQALIMLMQRHSDPAVRRDLWIRAQRLFYRDAPTILIGEVFPLHVRRREVNGYTPVASLHVFWNVWLADSR